MKKISSGHWKNFCCAVIVSTCWGRWGHRNSGHVVFRQKLHFKNHSSDPFYWSLCNPEENNNVTWFICQFDWLYCWFTDKEGNLSFLQWPDLGYYITKLYFKIAYYVLTVTVTYLQPMSFWSYHVIMLESSDTTNRPWKKAFLQDHHHTGMVSHGMNVGKKSKFIGSLMSRSISVSSHSYKNSYTFSIVNDNQFRFHHRLC